MNEAVSGKVQIDMRKRFFIEKVAGHWNRIPGKWTWPQASESRSIWMMLLITWFNFG